MNQVLESIIPTGAAIIRHISVDRTRPMKERIVGLGRSRILIEEDVLAQVANYHSAQEDVFFFRIDNMSVIGGEISFVELEKLYELYGLKPDPYAQLVVNELDLAFSDK